MDPFIAFNEFTYPNPPIDFISPDEDYSFLNATKGGHIAEKLKNFTIKLDITIETTNYACPNNNYFMPTNTEFTGILSTDLTSKWLLFYSSLFKITLVLKYFLNLKQLNNTYNGKNIFTNLLN